MDSAVSDNLIPIPKIPHIMVVAPPQKNFAANDSSSIFEVLVGTEFCLLFCMVSAVR